MKQVSRNLILFVISLFISSTALSQENVLEKDVHPWHKKAVMTCGMLRDMKTFSQEKMLSNLAELESELQNRRSRRMTSGLQP